MTTVAITGANGLIGVHLRARLAIRENVTVRCGEQAIFFDEAAMDAFLAGADAVVHLAYINRGTDSEVGERNPAMVRAIVEGCERAGSVQQIIFSSSTQIKRDNIYGRSKRDCTEVFRGWSGGFINLILPHIFGEYGKPFSNSVVSTFAHQFAIGETPKIDIDGDLELLHAGEVAVLIDEIIQAGGSGEIRPNGVSLKVSEMLARMSKLYENYQGGIIPKFDDLLDLQLFNTLRSHLFPGHYPVRLPIRHDVRGDLFAVVKTDHGGQCFLSTTKPGVTRGNHFHFHKMERFLVVKGEAVITLRRLDRDEVVEFPVCGSEPCYVDIPTLYTHSIRNTGDSELITIFWAHEIFDPKNPDTFHVPVYREVS